MTPDEAEALIEHTVRCLIPFRAAVRHAKAGWKEGEGDEIEREVFLELYAPLQALTYLARGDVQAAVETIALAEQLEEELGLNPYVAVYKLAPRAPTNGGLHHE